MNIFLILFIIILIMLAIYLYLLYSLKNDMKVGCLYNRWGCCPDKLTPKLDDKGTNCRGF